MCSNNQLSANALVNVLSSQLCHTLLTTKNENSAILIMTMKIAEFMKESGTGYRLYDSLRQFGIRLEQRELFSVLNAIPLNCLWFVVKETICPKCSDDVH